MRENADSLLDAAAAGLPRWMAAIALAGTGLGAASGHARLAAGFAAGAAVAVLAYGWLHRAVAAALDSSGARPARTMMLKFAMRYPLLLIAVVLCYQTGWLPLRGLVAGLFVPLGGAVLAGVVLAARIVRHGWGPAEAPPAELHP